MAATSLLLLAAFLSGCASKPAGDGAGATPAATYTVVAGGTPPPAATTTDTLHLLDRPHLTTRAPRPGDDVVRVPIDSTFGQTVSGMGTNSFADTWNFTLPTGVQGFVGNATMLAEVTGTLVNNPIPTADGCFWALSVVAGSVQTGEFHDLGCVREPAQVQAGRHQLSFPFTLADVSWPAGTELHFELHTQEEGPRAPGAGAELLTGAVDADSRIQVYGLKLPIDPPALLAQAGATS